ncbi:hypothetical protein UFOVP71_300 [uncultured Caudovirales phage]|uniref:Uncharacterized protein n=1 Tax=uncultured Caudovirales phage TaxID=2100421 RepID=A0A6J5TA93_9CAUD|nr:hypothetical protein UFOVP71_300 [uncultured Caudovirales phage]
MKFLKAIYSLAESFGQARAASYFARQGDFKSAKEAMNHGRTN